jgi:hypothetical protein
MSMDGNNDRMMPEINVTLLVSTSLAWSTAGNVEDFAWL